MLFVNVQRAIQFTMFTVHLPVQLYEEQITKFSV